MNRVGRKQERSDSSDRLRNRLRKRLRDSESVAREKKNVNRFMRQIRFVSVYMCVCFFTGKQFSTLDCIKINKLPRQKPLLTLNPTRIHIYFQS